MPLTRLLSTYLDCWRFIAASIVVLGHVDYIGIGSFGHAVGKYAHTMVVVFFVFSGYIIVRTTVDKKLSGVDYAILRASRIYTLAIPAVVLSGVLTYALLHLSPAGASADKTWQDISAASIASNLLFLNESWQNRIALSLNVPYWSLCYEVWYYIIFGFAFFLRGFRRTLAIVMATAVAGPAVMCLMPVWLSGALLARSRISWKPGPWTCMLMAMGSALSIIVMVETRSDVGIQQIVANYMPFIWRVEYSTKMVSDIIIGLAVCLHLLAVSNLRGTLDAWVNRLRPLATKGAAFSFSLYIFHDPLLRFAAGLGLKTGSSGPMLCLLMVTTVTACWLLSEVTEAKTSCVRDWLRDQIPSVHKHLLTDRLTAGKAAVPNMEAPAATPPT